MRPATAVADRGDLAVAELGALDACRGRARPRRGRPSSASASGPASVARSSVASVGRAVVWRIAARSSGVTPSANAASIGATLRVELAQLLRGDRRGARAT